MDNIFFFRYSSEVPTVSGVGTGLAGANLVYISPPLLDPSSDSGNICITDTSWEFPENNEAFANTINTFQFNNTVSDTANFLLTDKYSNTFDVTTLKPVNITIPVRPLWYQHIFAADAPIVAMNGTYIINVYDNNNNLISPDHYVLGNAGGDGGGGYPTLGSQSTAWGISNPPKAIYTDLINTIDTWYYVIYLSTNGQVKKLLSVQNIFREVSVPPSAYTQAAGPNPDSTYTLSYISATAQYQITTFNYVPQAIYSLKTLGTTKISVQHPDEASNTEPWYVNITNGFFNRSVFNSSTGGYDSYQYSIPEYDNQAWNPYEPYMFEIDEQPIFMDNNLLRLRQNPVVPPNTLPVGTNNINIYIRNSRERSDATNELINAAGGVYDATPYTVTSGNPVSGIWWSVIIDDYDINTGLVTTGGLISPSGYMPPLPADNLVYNSDDLHAFYYFRENDYVYTPISFNPIFDKGLLNETVSIYITPSRSVIAGVVQSSPASTTNHLVLDTTGNITDTSDPAMASLIGTNAEVFYTNYPNYLELGRVNVRNVASLKELTNNIVDVRIQGNNLVLNQPQSVIDQININTNGLYDLVDWQGSLLPGNSVVVIKVPTYLLNDNYNNPLTGAALTQRMIDIRTTCKKHLAAGVLPILRFYDNNTGVVVPPPFGNPPLDRVYF